MDEGLPSLPGLKAPSGVPVPEFVPADARISTRLPEFLSAALGDPRVVEKELPGAAPTGP